MKFIDEAKIYVKAGDGGSGCVSFRREKFVPHGGPDGGDGGRGGDVIIRASRDRRTLLDLKYRQHHVAKRGGHGEGGKRTGKDSEDVQIIVPVGTIVRNAETIEILADLVEDGASFIVAKGGMGGRGNARFATATRQTPRFAQPGIPGEERWITLELKLLADVGIIGLPNVGKSTFISRVSAARPKIADYPFTTLIPHLGVVSAGDRRFTVADVPGLIPGASEGRGLGLEFLRHIERCAVIVHVLDCATFEPNRDPVSDLDAIEAELAAYADRLEAGVPLMARPRIAVLTKIDVPEARELAQLVAPELRERGLEVHLVSAVSHEGLAELTHRLAAVVDEARRRTAAPAAPRVLVRPVDDAGFTVTRRTGPEGPYFQVRGEKPERWVRQTDFANDEAVGYLADRLARIGIEEELFRIGAKPGDMVVIGPEDSGVVFDWEPTLMTGPELLGPRGTDARLEEDDRPSRRERRREYRNRMDAKTRAREELWTERESGLWTDPGAE